MVTKRHDEGFTLIEVLLVIVVLGMLATVVVASVGGFSGEAEDTGCRADAHILATATEAYFAQHGTQVIPPVDGTPDTYEKSLADLGFLRAPSEFHDLDAAGRLVAAPGSPCTV